MNIRAAFLFLAFWSSGYLADAHSATVNFSQELYPLQVNDEAVEHSLFSKVTELTLTPGKYALKLKYSDLYELDYDEHEVVESEPFWVTMTISQQGIYQVLFKRPADVELAKQFAKKPSVKIQGPDNQVVSLQHIKQMPVNINDGTQHQPVASLAAQPSDTVTPSVSAVRQPKGVSHPDAYSMLEFWWQQANDSQRAAFLEKIKGQ
ncbi:hypothetical protein PA25_31320 [Pseudoalteromonas sp. A25]|uniref:DUF2057 family protein n=1 Tax=Pseudoalteromonas sp. A25 TaxID=116092 RepID=UPI001260BC96|nr:DUF2057 family protein [Pseudoalteromonas sp. A25]BBN83147.1 hypothetical protein PA25_31320 [Pseudoalteromonas sp. A25]